MAQQVKGGLAVSMATSTEIWELKVAGFPALRSLAYLLFHKHTSTFCLRVSWLEYHSASNLNPTSLPQPTCLRPFHSTVITQSYELNTLYCT